MKPICRIKLCFKADNLCDQEFTIPSETVDEIFCAEKTSHIEKLGWIALRRQSGKEFYLNMETVQEFEIYTSFCRYHKYKGYNLEYGKNTIEKYVCTEITTPYKDDEPFDLEGIDYNDTFDIVIKKFKETVDSDIEDRLSAQKMLNRRMTKC